MLLFSVCLAGVMLGGVSQALASKLTCYEVDLGNTSLVHCLNANNHRDGVQKYMSGQIEGSFFVYDDGCLVSGHKQGYPSFSRNGDFKVTHTTCDGSKLDNGDPILEDYTYNDGQVIQATGEFNGTDPFQCKANNNCKKVSAP